MMMDTQQRVERVKERALEKYRNRERCITRQLSLLSAALCCCLVYAAWHFSGEIPGAVQGLSGATMLLDNAGGYVLVGVICFIAAVVITALCIQIREKNNKQNKQTKEEKRK